MAHPRISFTARQKQALNLLKTRQFVLLDGGAQSGKTRVILEWILRCMLRYPGLRAFAGRAFLSDARGSLWQQTIPEIVAGYEQPGLFRMQSNPDLILHAANGSRLWVDGFDNRDRIEKILGKGFAILYGNEVSQMPYQAYTKARTRISQTIDGFRNQMIFDCNPPAPSHWIHKLFYDHVEPVEGKPLSNQDQYVQLLMNPMDNEQNLPPGYVESLDDLPEEEMRRFKLGEYVKPQGAVFKEFSRERHTLPASEIPGCDRYSVGVDLVSYAAVLLGFSDPDVYVLDEYGAVGITAAEMNEEIYSRWKDYNYVAYLDHNLGQSAMREFLNSTLAEKGPGSVEASINLIRQALKADNLYIANHCTGLLYELENYRRDDLGRIIKADDHYVDAMRYAVYSEASYAEPSVSYVSM